MSGAKRTLPVPEGGFQRIAVLRLSSLGDVILTLPVVHALRQRFPQARLTYWVKEEFAAVLRHDPAISHVRVLERGARRLEDLVSMSAELEDHDLLVDLHGNSRTRLLTLRQAAPVLRVSSRRLQRMRWVHARWTRPQPLPHTTERYAATLAPIGLEVAGAPQVALPDEALAWAAATLTSRAMTGPVVALAPGAMHATKRWPEERWCELESRLAASGVGRVVLSTASERRALPRLAAQVEHAAGAYWATESLERCAALLSISALAVTHDSGLMHLAAARGKRVVALFGSTSPVLGFAPCGEGHEILSRGLSCQPCTLHGRARCPKVHFRCMTDLTVAQVVAAVERLRAR